MSDSVQESQLAKHVESASSDPGSTEPIVEEVDLDSLQKGLAKAMVLQWKSDHPDESLDDIILSVTKATGSYSEVLLEKGVDRTLYDQWRYVKYKQTAPTLVRPKKPIEINLPEKTERQLLAQKLLREARENKKSQQTAEETKNADEKVVDKIELSNNEPLPTPTTPTGKAKESVIINDTAISSPSDVNHVERHNSQSVINSSTQIEKITPEKQRTDESISQPEDARDSLARIKKLLEQNKRTEAPVEIPSISTDASAFMKDLHNFTSTVSKKLTSNVSIENSTETPNSFENSDTKECKNEVKTEAKKDNLNCSTKSSSETTKSSSEDKKLETPVVTKDKEKVVEEKEQVEPKEETCSSVFLPGTKNILEKWQNQPSESTQQRKKRIVIVDDEEKEDEKPIEINHEIPQATKIADSIIEKGSTKHIMTQLLSSRNSIDAETPHEQEKLDIEKGSTKQLLDKWKSQDIVGSTTSPRRRVEIREEDGSVAENEPIERSDVIKSGVTEAPPIERGLTKQLLNQWSNVSDYKIQSSKVPIVISKQDGSVAENEPVQRDDVEREDSVLDPLQFVQKGTTKSMLEKWKTQNETEFKVGSKKIIINEEDGRCLESEPVMRNDVVRAADVNEEEPVEKGITSLMLNKWQQQNSNTSSPGTKSKTTVVIDDKDGVTAENLPEIKSDMARESDSSNVDDLSAVQQGITKSLLGKWSNFQTDFKKESKPVVILESDGHVSENQPTELSNVTRAEGKEGTTEISQSIKGMTKKLTNQWTEKSNETFVPSKKSITIDENAGCVAENDPTPKRNDVVRENEQNEELFPMKGQASLIKQQLISKKHGSVVRKEPIKLREDSIEEKAFAENEPVKRDDVAREEDFCEEVLHHRGFARNMVGFWNKPQFNEQSKNKQTVIELADGPTVFENNPTPSLLQHIQQASDSGVFENQPTSRQDVVREADYEPEIISANKTRNVRNLWVQKEIQSVTQKQSKAPELVCFTPPREKSPAQAIGEEFKSTHTLTLKNSK